MKAFILLHKSYFQTVATIFSGYVLVLAVLGIIIR